jgi:tetratricopeptide (TPR) repeat protein
LDKRTRIVIGYVIVAVLIGVSILAYLTLHGPGPADELTPYQTEYAESGLREGIYQYRLENYERAEILLQNMLGKAESSRTASMAALYLGNIAYRKGDPATALTYYGESIDLDRSNVYAFHNASLAAAREGNWRRALVFSKKAVELSGRHTASSLFLANLHYGAGRYAKAEEIYKRHMEATTRVSSTGETPVEAEPADRSSAVVESAIFRYNLARIYLGQGRASEARDLYRDLVSGTAVDPLLGGLCHYALGMLAFGEDDSTASLHVEEALEIFSSVPVKFNRALILVREGRFGEAASLLRTLMDGNGSEYASGSGSRSSQDHHLSFLYGYALYRSGRYESAIGVWERAYKQDRDPFTARVLGDLYFNLEEMEEAERYYRAAVEDPNHLAAYENLVRIHVLRGEYDRAENTCGDYAARAEGDPSPQLCFADLYLRTGRLRDGRAALEKARRMTDDAEFLMRIGALYTRYGMFNSSLHLYNQLLTLHPDRWDVHGRIAEVYLLAGHRTRARDQLRRAIGGAVDADHDDHYRLSLLLALVEDRDRRGLLLEEIIAEYPARHEAYHNRALLSIESGEYDAAIQTVDRCLDNAVHIDDGAASLLQTISGIASKRLGAYDDAARYFSRAVELDESNEFASINLRLVQNGRF